MGLAMVPLRRLVAGFPQLVRELAAPRTADDPVKDVALVLTGQDVELDTRVLDAVADALRHLVTNAVDHGCESPAERIQAGKPPQATVTVSARAAGSTVVIEVSDDGRGVDEAALRAVAIARGALPADSAVTGAALLQVLFSPASPPATRSPRPPAAASAWTSSAPWSRTSAAPSRCAPSPVAAPPSPSACP
jgi:chemotaxis protein histidine kinase CheA